MLSFLLSLTFAQAVDSLYRLYGDVVKEEGVARIVEQGLSEEEARRIAFAELLFSADSGLFFTYRNNSALGKYYDPVSTLRRLPGKGKLPRDCDEIAPIGTAALRALGLPVKIGFYSNHVVTVLPREGQDIVVDFSFPGGNIYKAYWGFYKGLFYDSSSYEWMGRWDRRYRDVFTKKVKKDVDRILRMKLSKRAFGIMEKRLKAWRRVRRAR